MQKKKLLSIGEAAVHLGISRDTLRRWEKKGKIAPLRSPTNRRYYTTTMLDQLVHKEKEEISTAPAKPQSLRKDNLTKIIILGVVGFLLAAVIVSILQFSF